MVTIWQSSTGIKSGSTINLNLPDNARLLRLYCKSTRSNQCGIVHVDITTLAPGRSNYHGGGCYYAQKDDVLIVGYCSAEVNIEKNSLTIYLTQPNTYASGKPVETNAILYKVEAICYEVLTK